MPDRLPLEAGSTPINANILKRELAEAQVKVDELQAKVIHGVYARELRKTSMDARLATEWLRSGRLHPETEATLVAEQDGVTSTAAYRSRVQNSGEDQTCRVCREHPEMLGHILSRCPGHAWALHKERHDQVLFVLVRAITEKHGLARGLVKPGVVGDSRVKMLVDQRVPTGRHVTENRPDLIVRLREGKRIIVLEVACAWDPLVVKRELEKRNKYARLKADLAKQWPGYTVVVIPVVVGDLGIVSDLREHLRRAKLLTGQEIWKLAVQAQRITLTSAVQIIKQHMTY